MHKIKRAHFLFLQIEDEEMVDMEELLRGNLRLEKLPRLKALSILKQETYPIDQEDLDLLKRVPSHRWASPKKLFGDTPPPEQRLDELLSRGLLLSDAEGGPHARLAEAERKLKLFEWHPQAALLHFLDPAHRGQEIATRNRTPGPEATRDRSQAPTSEEALEERVERHGPPPEAFHRRPSATASIGLPKIRREGQLYRALETRRSCRSFDPDQALSKESLATLLYYSMGCQGTTDLSSQVMVLRRCSPSGGSLHPIEAYVLAAKVEGVEPGCYHYNGKTHSLDLLQALDTAGLGDLLVELSNGQSYIRGTHVLIVLTARFYRNFWKYRGSARTYGVLLMDAAHISQNFYLLAADLGLGAFFSGAINGPKIEALLTLDPVEEGAIAILGCGPPTPGISPMDLARKPFNP